MRGSTLVAAAGWNPSLDSSNPSSHPGTVQGRPIPEAPRLVRVRSGGIQPAAAPRPAKMGPTMFVEMGIMAGMAEDKGCVVMLFYFNRTLTGFW